MVAFVRLQFEGAAGNFLAPISGLSENAFRTVIEIDTVRIHLSHAGAVVYAQLIRIDSLVHTTL